MLAATIEVVIVAMPLSETDVRFCGTHRKILRALQKPLSCYFESCPTTIMIAPKKKQKYLNAANRM